MKVAVFGAGTMGSGIAQVGYGRFPRKAQARALYQQVIP